MTDQNTTQPNAIPTQNLTQPQKSWLDEESEELAKGFTGERLPYMKFEENKIIEIDVDFSKPFANHTDKGMDGKEKTKAIIPVTHNGERKNWWLNKSNPTYRELVTLGKVGQTHFKILQTGNQQNTKYVLVK